MTNREVYYQLHGNCIDYFSSRFRIVIWGMLYEESVVYFTDTQYVQETEVLLVNVGFGTPKQTQKT